MNLEGEIAIVTGAASGLGAATAKALAKAGMRLALVDLDEQRLLDTVVATDGMAVPFDVADAAAAEAGVKRITDQLGAPRILINCAGIATGQRIVGRSGPMPLADFERVIRVNLIGSFNMLRLAAASMTKLEPQASGERGLIVNTASVAAFEGQIGQAAYAASKGGVHALVMPAARELASSGIRVMAIAPGLFATPMLLGMPQTVQDSLQASVPFPQRFGTPEEYAELVLAIAANPMLNGTTIRLDGALRMAPR